MGHGLQQAGRVGLARWIDEAPGPVGGGGVVRILTGDDGGQVGRVFGIVGERPGARLFVGAEMQPVLRRVVQHDIGLEGQRVGLTVELGDGDAVVEGVVHPEQVAGFGMDAQRRRQQALILAVARPEQDAVLPEADRPLVAVGGDVVHAQKGHGSKAR